MRKEKDLPVLKRFILPMAGLLGSTFMVFAALYSHGYIYYIEGQKNGVFSCPVLFYLIVFVVVMIAGLIFMKQKNKILLTPKLYRKV
jgi:APA family basic amino acid/polyamine antiporter